MIDMKTWGVRSALVALSLGGILAGAGGCAPTCPEGQTLNDKDECVLDCPSGSAPNADQTTCVLLLQCGNGFVFDSEAQGCVCAAGTEPTADGNGCILPPVIEPLCGIGFTLNETRDACVAIPETALIVHGIVKDQPTGQPIAGATVTLHPQSDDAPATTDANGYFEFTNNLEPGTYHLQYIAAGHAYTEAVFSLDPDQVDVIRADIGALDTFQQDMSISLARLPEAFTVAGTVYVEDRTADGATVQLIANGTTTVVAETTTDADGKFKFENVRDANLNVRVPGFDEDADGVLDFGRGELQLGQLRDATTSGDGDDLNLTNLVIQLQGMQKRLLATNFLPDVRTRTLAANDTFNGLRLLTGTTPIILHFGHEVNIDVFHSVLQQIEVGGGVPGERIDATINHTVTWNTERTVATITPAQTLLSDVNDNHFYRFFMDSFRWADDDELLPLERTARITFNFDIAATPINPPASPTPSFFFTDRIAATGVAAESVSCDAFACWIVDVDDAPVFGYASPFAGVNTDSFFHEQRGFSLQWTHVDGAVNYRIHARQVNAEPSFANFSAFSEATGAVTFQSAVVPNIQPTIHASGVLAGNPGGVQRTWLDFGLNGFGPLGAGNTIEIAVTSIDVFGNESAIDPTKVITIGDERAASINVAAFTPVPNNDAARLTETTTVSFSEAMDTTTTPTFVGLAGNTRATPTATFLTWDDSQAPTVPENFSNVATIVTDIRHQTTCTEVTCDMVVSDPNRDRICVRDASAISNNAGLVFVNANGATLNDGADGAVILNVTAVDATNNLLTVAAAGVSGTLAIPRTINGSRTFACSIGGATAAQTLSAGAAAADTSFTVANASAYRAGQRLFIIDPSTTPNTVANVLTTHVDTSTATNRITTNNVIGQTLTTAAVVIALPETAGRREAAVVELRSVANTVAGNNTLSFTNALLSTGAMVGDTVMVDVDGDLETVDDHFFGSIVDLIETPANGATNERIDVVLGNPPTGFSALPAGITLERQTTRVIFLGDAWQISGGTTDTSGNAGLSTFRRAFASCTSIRDAQAAEQHCLNGSFAF